MKKQLVAASATIGAALLLAVSTPLAAAAHVSLEINTAEAGSYSLLTFTVPNEQPVATTSRLELHLPPETPFASVSYVPTPGWDADLVTTTLPEPVGVGESEITEAVTSVIFTAQDGVGITAGQLQLFAVSVGPVPDVDSVALTIDQEYSDGSITSWNGEGDNPAPVLYVNATPEDDHHADGDVAASDAANAGDDSDAAAGFFTDALARVLGILALVVAAVALALTIRTARR